MGAAVRIPVIEAGAMPDAIARLREKGITCLAAALYKSQPLSAAQASYPGGVCVVIGSEGQGLTDETVAACSSTVRIPYAAMAYTALNCEGLARCDFFVEKGTGRVLINEINTFPGFTSISMYPKLMEHEGLPVPALIDRLIELALERTEKQHG